MLGKGDRRALGDAPDVGRGGRVRQEGHRDSARALVESQRRVACTLDLDDGRAGEEAGRLIGIDGRRRRVERARVEQRRDVACDRRTL